MCAINKASNIFYQRFCFQTLTFDLISSEWSVQICLDSHGPRREVTFCFVFQNFTYWQHTLTQKVIHIYTRTHLDIQMARVRGTNYRTFLQSRFA